MAPKIPRGFGGSKSKVDEAPISKVRHLSKKGGDQQEINYKDVGRNEGGKKDGKRLMDPSQEATPSKKSKSQSAPSTHVANLFGPISAAYVGENAVHKWQSLTSESQDLSMIQASAQLLVQTIRRAQKCQEERLAFEKLKADNKNLAEMIVESDNKWNKDSLDNVSLSQRFHEVSRPVNDITPPDNVNNTTQGQSSSGLAVSSSEASSPEDAPTRSSISPAVNSSSPPKSPVPFIHWKVVDREIDLDWGEYEDMSEKDKDSLRKQSGSWHVLGCGLSPHRSRLTGV